MAINLHTKYAPAIEQQFVIESLLAGKASNEVEFDGVQTVKATTIITQALADYSRTTGFGTAANVEDWIQDFKLNLEKKVNMRIDALDQSDQGMVKAAGPILRAEMEEQVAPFFDKNTLFQWAYKGGASTVMAAATTKSNIISYINLARTAFVNAKVPKDNRYIALKATEFSKVLESAEFIAADTGVGAMVENGVVGKISGFKVVEVPDDYLPTDALFVCWHKKAVIDPMKVKLTRIIDSESFAGKLLQALFYGGAFIVGPRANGVYTAIAYGSSAKVALPVITPTGASHAITSATSGAAIWYTIDGTDPRYSASRTLYASAVTLASGVTIKAYATKADMFDSIVVPATYTA